MFLREWRTLTDTLVAILRDACDFQAAALCNFENLQTNSEQDERHFFFIVSLFCLRSTPFFSHTSVQSQCCCLQRELALRDSHACVVMTEHECLQCQLLLAKTNCNGTTSTPIFSFVLDKWFPSSILQTHRSQSSQHVPSWERSASTERQTEAGENLFYLFFLSS